MTSKSRTSVAATLPVLLLLSFSLTGSIGCRSLAASNGHSQTLNSRSTAEHLASSYQRESENWLTHDEARLRSRTLSNVVYNLNLDLTDVEAYTGSVIIEFDYEPSPFPVTLDFRDGRVDSVQIDSKERPVAYNGKFLSIEPRFLRAGRNRIAIRYSHSYSETGAGLYRFVDAIDKRVYVYTHFEPFDANQLIPCFDQPNLRANWLVSVRVPNDWHVISAVREQSTDRQGEAGSVWHFPITPKISSYIFPLHAGPYHVWESMAGEIPLRLFARESLAEYVRAESLLKLTRDGLAYFQEYFDEPYPFSKYDQLFVPDFNIGGMENVAAVTYTEYFIPRGEPTREFRAGVAGIFLHEMSHMWFGDLVTIDWWNALWLKESFASLMAPMALLGATEFDEAWLDFYLNPKQRAYTADQLVTTHAIEMAVRDTKSGFASFDSITYSKGASVLKQLKHFLGEESFREGVRTYMNRHFWRAAKLPDFMDTLAEGSGRDLKTWTREWIETAGVNSVLAEYECQNNEITEFRLIQTAPDDYPTLRSHRLQTGLYRLVDGAIELQKAVAIELRGKSTPIPEFIGESCPLLVYPNLEDWAYIRVQLDKDTLRRVPEQLDRIADPLLRSMFWQSLWDAVIDVNAPLSQYLNIALIYMPAEKDTTLLQQLLRKLSSSQRYLFLFGDRASDLRRRFLPALEAMVWQQVLMVESGSNARKQWFDAWLELARSEVAQSQIEKWLGGDSEPRELNQDQDRRWKALIQLSANGYPNTNRLSESEKERDPSDTGKMAMITLAAAWPEADVKARYLNAIDEIHGTETSAMLKAAMRRMFSSGQEGLHQEFGARILNALPRIDEQRDQQLVNAYVSALLPALCTAASVERLAKTFDSGGGLGLIASKALRVAHQEDQRCVDMAARELDGMRALLD